MTCPIHGECPICKTQKALGDPREGVEVVFQPDGLVWRNPAPDAAAPMAPTGQIRTVTVTR